MHVPLYQALLAAKIPAEKAEQLVAAMDAHIESRVTAANATLLAELSKLGGKLDGVNLRLDSADKAKDARVRTWQWAIGSLIAGSTATIGALKAFGLL